MQKRVTRFAPSPTGYLHLGHAHAAMIAWARAREAGGQFLLRIENIDATRCRPEYEAGILDDMAWLCLGWDGPVRRQQDHLPEYRAVLEQLRAQGLLYPCFCTRADIAREVAASGQAPHGPDGPIYPGTCARLSAAEAGDRIAAGEAHAWRLRTRVAHHRVGALGYEEEGQGRIICAPEVFGDVVLARKDCPGSYHLCVTHDDAAQGVTLVTRGKELRAATDIHRLIQALMGWPAPIYAHHALLTDQHGAKLSKRDGALSLRALRAEGISPAEAFRRAGIKDAFRRPARASSGA
ncbi:tRNA glutamyl-Q(34) synthetase GluQRS [Acidisoma cellulosilytica]|uniref:tRNA glutamyl-Q(34) synthetase GluQRS n=1 Tax=Acidisoma cellulosilyticum TaxID=2802395 RepID=A0A963YY90_9PROT|nr:tRNA glutamyl-Q(34) synthetase GluQRS [Acidisoma cellulosilyticum]MCB8879412.1 tRNA glutamyl-Q(34) synthetase GluQRS [Acidisoma cellulosilyticum]